MFLIEGWEMFCTERKKDDQENEIFDELSIDILNKRFILDKNMSIRVTKKRECMGHVWGANCIRSENFDMLVEMLKLRGYTELG